VGRRTATSQAMPCPAAACDWRHHDSHLAASRFQLAASRFPLT
jgi:hypothetical protein